MQDYFQLLVHAQQCRARCAKRRICAQMQAHLQHYTNCKDRMCQYLNCFKARLLLNHYRSCTTSNCKICPPRRIEYKPRYSLCSLLRMLFGIRRSEETAETSNLLTEEERRRITATEATEALMGVLPDPNDQEDIQLTTLLRDLAETHQNLEKQATEAQFVIEKIIEFRMRRQISKINHEDTIPNIPKQLIVMSQKALGREVEDQEDHINEASSHASLPETGIDDSFCEYKSTGEESDVDGFDECEPDDQESLAGGSTSSKDDATESTVSSISFVEEAVPDTSSGSDEWEVLQNGQNMPRS